MRRLEATKKQLGPVIKEALQTPLGPTLALAPKRRQAQHRFLLNRGIPENADGLLVDQQPKTQIQVIGDRGFIEPTAAVQGIEAEQLAITPQFRHPCCSKTALLDHRIESHLHGLQLGEPIHRGIHLSLAQLHRRPTARFGIGNEPLKRVGLEISIGIQDQHPPGLQLLKHLIEGPGFAPACIGGPPEQTQKRKPVLEIRQHLRCAIRAAVINHPQLEQACWVTHLGHPLHQPTNHRLFIPGGHHHIDRWPSLQTLGEIGFGGLRWLLGGPQGWRQNRSNDVTTQQQRHGDGRDQADRRI